MKFNPLDYSNALEFPSKTLNSTWNEHLSFAGCLVEMCRPRLYVELGTAQGASLCGFCQAIAKSQIECKCVGIDHWQGDAQAKNLPPNSYQELRDYHDPLYGKFSRLLRSSFDDALSEFEDGSIDLLHIDGLHTYDAVRHDFETWTPRLSNRAVVIFHDTNVFDETYGVHKFWAEISARYPHFEFKHGYGLGVLGVGESFPDPIRQLTDASPEEVIRIRSFFEFVGKAILVREELAEIERSKAYRTAKKFRTVLHRILLKS